VLDDLIGLLGSTADKQDRKARRRHRARDDRSSRRSGWMRRTWIRMTAGGVFKPETAAVNRLRIVAKGHRSAIPGATVPPIMKGLAAVGRE